MPARIQYGSEREKGKGIILKRVHPRASLAYIAFGACLAWGSYGEGDGWIVPLTWEATGGLCRTHTGSRKVESLILLLIRDVPSCKWRRNR